MGSIFNYGINISGTHQGFYGNWDNMPVNVAPECAVDITDLHSTGGVILPVPSVIEYFKSKNIHRFYMRRTFAMGDVLMLVPVIRYLRTLGFDPYLRTRSRYFDILDRFGIDARGIQFGPEDPGIELDRTVEMDHSRPEVQGLHRINIYLSALGFNKFPRRLNWEYNKSKFPSFGQLENFKFKEKDYIVFQGSGSTKAKSLSKTTIEGILNSLNRKGENVVYIGNPINLTLEMPEMTQVACVTYDFFKLFPMLEHAKSAVIMDSGPLWLSHFTETPVVVIFGPTNPNARLPYHPLYPKKVKAVEANKHIDCKRCYEAAERCNHEFRCLHIPLDILFNDLYSKLLKI